MKKITMSFYILILCLVSMNVDAQILNENANWPNENWIITGSYSNDSDSFEANPTLDANFAFDDNDAGSGSDDEIAAESPVINLTDAYEGGETFINFSADYFYRIVAAIENDQGDLLILDYWDEDNQNWESWSEPIIGTEGSGGPNTNNYCSAEKTAIDIAPLNVANFTANQLENFKYRIRYDDNGQAPNTTGWEYGFCFDSPTIYSETPPTCLVPTDIEIIEITSNSVELTWMPGSTESAWEVIYGEPDFDVETEGTSIEVDEAQAEITNLGADEEYDFYVRAICSDSDNSAWSNAITFSTLIESVIVSQESPVENETYCYGDNDFKEWLFESENGEVLNINFNSGSVEEYLYFGYFFSTNDDIVIYDGQDDSGEVLFDSDEDEGDLQGLSFNAYSGFIYITLESNDSISCDSGDEETLDFDVTVVPCSQPQEFMAENITTSTADLTWVATGDETEWEVLYGLAGFDTDTEGTSVTVDNGIPSLNLDSLETAALYDVYVRAICSDDDASLWSFATFSTRPENDDCDNAIELQLNEGLECTVVNSATNVGATASSQEDDITGTPNNDVWFSFTATAPSHIISLDNIVIQAGASTDMGMAVYDATEGCDMLTLVDDSDPNTLTLEDMTIGNTYLLRVYGYSANNSAQTSFDVCIQTIQCPVPMELSIGGFTTSSADVTWVAGGSETEWEILYGEEGFDTETDGILVSDSDGIIGETISELSDNTTYEVYLRAVCGDDSESELVGPVSFTTLPEPVIVTSENPVMNETYCYTDNEFNQWLFEAENGETLQISFNAGTLEEFYDWWTGNTFTYDDLIIYDGQDDTGEVLFNSDEDGYELEGLSFDALSGYIFMTLDSDVSGSCDTASEVPFDFDVYILSCLEPTEVIVENITSNTAELTWVSNGEESEWEILYGEIGFDPETEGISVIDNDGELDYLLENLNSNAEYEVYVRAICAEDDLSQWSDSATFTTDCDIYIPYYLESFDEFLPACWEEAGSGLPSEGPSEFGTGSWFDDEFLNTGTNMAATINLYTTGREEWLISPSFDLSGNTYELTYQVATSVYTNSDPSNMGSDDEVQLLISEDNGVTWQNLMTYNTDNAPGAEATSQTIDLSSYSGTVKFAFWATDGEVNDDEDYDFFIDDFEITETLSVSNSNFIGFNYYPNPVKTNLHLEATKSSIETVTVYDLLGKKVFTQKYNTLSADLNLSNLESGSYVVVVNINNQSKTIRFIKE
ncbi:fibronectin type III domain-containing protein [Mesonia mobilis]|nr:fibronectin type III domain-containing protein [Mesonia mobilis]MBQ0737189.1 fibronectin type III domain-containing protein [Aquimarina celericrescens]